ncbi:uncharacterized protein LOC106156950 [Lingula anatina]|uniref:Uncharacterized protein LOC106156950 n=1 Tax=Lingula anatina TaxID=7574 RepID=A0A1S3HP81_LINAN|nr:uncharacterized protein LOC106156950 [Lingula anatina]|eukprot:XP_013387852.1 uncharacterized protein LOC106156950 [Lingula anatina]
MAEFRPLDDEDVEKLLAQIEEILEIANKLLQLMPDSAPPPAKMLRKIIEFLNTDAGKLATKELLPYIVRAVCYVDKYIRQLELLQNANAFLQDLFADEDVLQAISTDLRKAEGKIQVIENRMNTLDEILHKPTSECRPLNNQEKRSFTALTIQLDASLKNCQWDLDHLREEILELEKKAKVKSGASRFGKWVSFAAGVLAVVGLWTKSDKLTTNEKIGLGATAAGCVGLGLGMHVVGEVMDRYKKRLSSIQARHDELQKKLDSLQEVSLRHQQAEKILSPFHAAPTNEALLCQ